MDKKGLIISAKDIMESTVDIEAKVRYDLGKSIQKEMDDEFDRMVIEERKIFSGNFIYSDEIQNHDRSSKKE